MKDSFLSTTFNTPARTSTSMRSVFWCLAFILFLPSLVLAQIDLDNSVTGRMLLGQPRDTIVVEMKEWVDGLSEMEKVTDKESLICYDNSLLHRRQCYRLVNGICRSITVTVRKESREDVSRSLGDLMGRWGQPITYAAESEVGTFTEVDSFEKATLLAKSIVAVAFPVNQDGVALLWQWNTTPGEEGLTGGRYRYGETYIDLSYIDSLTTKNYWE